MRKRDAARRALRSHSSSADYDAFRSLRNLVQSRIDGARNKYLLARLGSITGSAKLWAELRSLGLARPKSSCFHFVISPNQLNSFFTSVHLFLRCPALLHRLSSPSPLSLILSISPSPPLSDPSIFYFFHITPDVLRNAFLTCSSNSTGPDGINRRLVIHSLPVVFPVILDLFNSSLNTSTFRQSGSSLT